MHSSNRKNNHLLSDGVQVFDAPPWDVVNESAYTASFLPVLSPNRSDVVEFIVPASSDLFIDTSEIFLYMKCQLKSAKVGTEVAPCSPFFYLLWEKIEVELNGVPLLGSYRNNGYKAFFQILFSQSKCVKTSLLETVLWAPDTSEHAKLIDVSPTTKNAGLKFRHALTAGEKVFEMEDRLTHELFALRKYLPPKMEIKIRLYRRNSEFSLVSPDPDESFQIALTDLKLNVRMVKPSDHTLSLLEKQLATKPAMYHIPHASDVQTRILTKDVKTISIPNFFNSEKLPDRIVFGLIPQQTYLGNLRTIPTVFEPHGLEEISLSYRNHTLKFKTDFDKGLYMELYVALATQFKGRHEQCAPNIKYDEIAKTFALFPFDLGTFKESADRSTNYPPVQLDLKFKDFLTEPLQLLCYTEFPRTFMIDKNRQLIDDSKMY